MVYKIIKEYTTTINAQEKMAEKLQFVGNLLLLGLPFTRRPGARSTASLKQLI